MNIERLTRDVETLNGKVLSRDIALAVTKDKIARQLANLDSRSKRHSNCNRGNISPTGQIRRSKRRNRSVIQRVGTARAHPNEKCYHPTRDARKEIRRKRVTSLFSNSYKRNLYIALDKSRRKRGILRDRRSIGGKAWKESQSTVKNFLLLQKMH